MSKEAVMVFDLKSNWSDRSIASHAHFWLLLREMSFSIPLLSACVKYLINGI